MQDKDKEGFIAEVEGEACLEVEEPDEPVKQRSTEQLRLNTRGSNG